MQSMQSVRIVYPVAVLPTKKKIEKYFAARFIRELSAVPLSRAVTQTCASHFSMWRSPGSPRSRARNGRKFTFSPAQRTIREANWRASPQCCQLESLRYSSIVRYFAIHDVSRNIDSSYRLIFQHGRREQMTTFAR